MLPPGKGTDKAERAGLHTARMPDIPPRLRLVFTVAAFGGLIFIGMGSLAAAGEAQIRLDKIIHGVGYLLLGMLVVMGLPPRWYLPALLGIVAAGVGLEFAQKRMLPGRSFEVADVVANSTGLLIGMCVGFLARMLWAYVGGELAALADRRRVRRCTDGECIFRQGEASDCLYLIRHGRVEIFVDGKPIAHAGSGETVGEMGLIENLPRSATAIASGSAVLFRLDREDFEQSVGDHEHPALGVARVLAARLRVATSHVVRQVSE